jgi:hypothetical protein
MTETTKPSFGKRYPGVKPFETAERDLFFGRDRDIEDLLVLMRLEKLMVLFGKSGYGKSSLINAGILPQLPDDTQAIVVRLGSYSDGQTRTPLDTLRSKMDEGLTDNPELDFLNNGLVQPTLWQQMKRKQNRQHRRFVFIFDQFEEFFTYPLAAQKVFKEQLAELLYTEVPQSLRKIADSFTDDQQDWLATPFDAKALFAIRADRMSLLDSMKDKLPAILQKRYELKGLTEAQAQEAITRPALLRDARFITPPFEYTRPALDKILSELSDNRNKAIEAFQVQIVCEEIEKEVEKGTVPDRDNNGLPDVAEENLPDFDNLYENYYRRKIEELTPSVQKAARLLIEEKLIFDDEKTGEARRLSVDSGVLLHDTGVNQALLNQLESSFLLRREANAMGGFNYEVSHDTMIAPILKSKAERKAKEKAELERLEAQRKQRRLILLLMAVGLALLIVIGIVVYVFNLRNEAVAAKDEANKAKNEAITERDNARKALEDKEITEYRSNIMVNMQSLLERGISCPDAVMIRETEIIRKKYPNNAKLQQDIKGS